MSILKDVNTQSNKLQNVITITSDNITSIAIDINESQTFISEAITQWLAKVNNTISSGKTDPQKLQSVAEILGAVSAISNTDIADAFDTKNDLGTTLFLASSQNKQQSNSALKRLREIGRHPSTKTHTQNASNALKDPAKLNQFINNIKSDIDKTMRSKLHKEKLNNS